MEKLALEISQETWMRQRAGETEAWLVPSFNGTTRVKKPPMLVWMHMLAWSALDPATSTPDQCMLRARLVSVTLTLLILASTFWIGLALGDRRLALLATLIAGSNLLLRHQGRLASYDVHLVAWSTLAIAAALWAMRPFGLARTVGGQVVGWSIACVAMAMAWLSKGPLALVIVGLPLLGVIAIVPGRRVAALVGLCCSIALSAALALPWYFYVRVHGTDVVGVLQHDYGLTFARQGQPFYYYLGLFGLAIPWTIWFVVGLVLPCARKGRDSGRRVLAYWLWFVTLFVFFSLSPAREQRYALPLIPAAALLTAQVWRDLSSRSERGESPRWALRMGTLHWGALLLGSLGFGAAIMLQCRTVAPEWLDHLEVPRLSRVVAAAVSVILIGVAVQGWRWHRHGKLMRAAYTTAAWTILVLTLHSYGSSEDANEQMNVEARRMGRLVGTAPIRYLVLSSKAADRPAVDFLFYLRRVVPPITAEELPDYASKSPPVYVLAADRDDYAEKLRESQFASIAEFKQGRVACRLWEHWPHSEAVSFIELNN